MLIPLEFGKLISPDQETIEFRNELYHPDKPGYIILRNYVSPAIIKHLHQVWYHDPPPAGFMDTEPIEPKIVGQRPFAGYYNRRTCYHNYFWNKPWDEVSHNICFAVNMLRNQLEQAQLYTNLAPNGKRLASYRVLISKSYKEGEIEVQPHNDFSTETYRIDEPESQHYLQATLFLSEHNIDYTGQGFFFTTNQGERLYPGSMLDIKAGDLMIWRYINRHGVDATQALPNGIGFMRIIFPNEDVNLKEVHITPFKKFSQKLKQMIS